VIDPRGFRIVLDPGHGGTDPGAVANRLREATINLEVAKLIAYQLPAPQYDVILTREADVFVPLARRSELSNSSRARLFVSLHCNAASSPKANGFEVLHHSTSEAGAKLARSIHLNTKALFREDRGLKARDDLHVLRETDCPAVLVEMGFVTNSKDAHMLASRLFYLSLAKAIASGILAYKP
jgi:N-acetylmuramoyl-L-alanine amidase